MATKSLKSFIILPRVSRSDAVPSTNQSMDSNIISSTDFASGTSSPPNQSVNANMPQPPPSNRALSSLSIPSYTNEQVNSVNESDDDFTEVQQRLPTPTAEDVPKEEIQTTDENDNFVKQLFSKRQSARIQNLKRAYTMRSTDGSSRKKTRK